MIPDAAVEAAAKAMYAALYTDPFENQQGEGRQEFLTMARAALEAAAPHMLEQAERELSDAKRVIALLVLEAGGKVSISRRAVAELSDNTLIETTQDVINGGWVIRAGTPA